MVLPLLSVALISPPLLPLLTPTLLRSPPYRLVRKKLGEIVKLVIRDLHHRRVQLMPLTPTYKLVHFGEDTDVKYFKKRDKPLAISNPNSPEYSSLDLESAFEEDLTGFSLNSKQGDTKYPGMSRWLLDLLNFPPLSYTKKFEDKTPVFLERVFISQDRLLLNGHIAVQNLAFEKSVTVRYSLDNWLTIIEIPTKYNDTPPDILRRNNHDRFVFDIPLELLFNSFYIQRDNDGNDATHKTYEFCIRYNTGSEEYWDNNDFKNYRIRLLKKTTPVEKPLASLAGKHVTPRYSLSYLKRRVLDSHIINKHESSSGQPSQPSQPSNEGGYRPLYLPMFPLFNHRQDGHGKDDHHHLHPPSELARPPHHFLDSKLYKELLDNYCFFKLENEDANNAPPPVKPFSVDTFLHS